MKTSFDVLEQKGIYSVCSFHPVTHKKKAVLFETEDQVVATKVVTLIRGAILLGRREFQTEFRQFVGLPVEKEETK